MRKNSFLFFLTSMVLIALLSLAMCMLLPWWSIVFAAALVTSVFPMNDGKNFLSGFLSLALTWGLLAFYLSWRNEHLLAHKISILMLKADNPFLLIAVTSLIGGLVGGMGALCGGLVRKLVVK